MVVFSKLLKGDAESRVKDTGNIMTGKPEDG